MDEEQIYRGEKKFFEKEEKNEPVTDKSLTERKIAENQQYYSQQEAQDQQYEQEKNRIVNPENFRPSNSIDVAHLLISSSELTSFMPELDKEIKLANLNKEEKASIWEFQSVWEDIMFLRRDQERRKQEFIELYGNYELMNEEDARMERIEKKTRDPNEPDFFDSLSTLKKSERVAVISRGSKGFERTQQVSTISTYKNENVDQSEEKPNFLQRLGGGFRR